MKKIFIISVLYVVSNNLKAQNIFPSSGYVGIGTSTPATTLDVFGPIANNRNWLYLAGAGDTNHAIGNIGGDGEQFRFFNFLDFYQSQSGLSRLYINNNGNVGIGTTTPNAKLDVNGMINIGYTMNYPSFGQSTLHIGGAGTSASTAPFWVLENATAYNGITPLLEAHILSDGTNNPELGITTGGRPGFFKLQSDVSTLKLVAHDDIIFNTMAGAETMRITNTGNVGIGLTAPRSSLDVWGGAINVTGTDHNGTAFITSFQGTAYFGNNSMTNGIAVLPTGNIGIGTTDPGSYKLAVNRTMHAKSVIIDLIGWPDYVFKKDYQLMPLAQVKSYIEQNQHLPGLPTDKEVETKGLDVGEMNKLLAKKVEELTLYLIEKDKQISQQQIQINQMNKSLKKLTLNKQSAIN